MGADTSVVKEKHERNPMPQEQKKDSGKHQDMEERRRKKHWTPTGSVPTG